MGLFGGLGTIINDVTGATSAAQSGQKYSKRLAAINNAYQKEFAQNAHQWEMADLKAAGLNPALTATGGSGASASGGGGFDGSGISGGVNPIEIINQIVGMQNQTSAVKSQNALNKAQAIKIIEMLPLEKKEKQKYIDLLIEQKKYTGYFPTTVSSGVTGATFGHNNSVTRYSKGGVGNPRNPNTTESRRQQYNSKR